jgi:hypothetical protein
VAGGGGRSPAGVAASNAAIGAMGGARDAASGLGERRQAGGLRDTSWVARQSRIRETEHARHPGCPKRAHRVRRKAAPHHHAGNVHRFPPGRGEQATHLGTAHGPGHQGAATGYVAPMLLLAQQFSCDLRHETSVS